jgi:YgiT-type zinc finger domain-containing protein
MKGAIMSENFGRCPLCGGDKRPGTTIFAVDLKFGVVVVREVPALVCSKCGDAWIDDPVAARLEVVVADAREKQAEVEVTQWQQVAA